MPAQGKARIKAEFGDFQTPKVLAERICALLVERGLHPAGVLEPTCGSGAFLDAAIRVFPSARRLIGCDINPRYVAEAKSLLRESHPAADIQVRRTDFFRTDWAEVLTELPKPLLILGNPPWVTSAELGSLGSSNLPEKTNFQRQRGIDALMGKSNFDISEWMLLRGLEWIEGQEATLAVLCKVAVARKVLRHAWKHGHRLRNAEVHRIDAFKYFGASVDACLFIVSGAPQAGEAECAVYDSLQATGSSSLFGFKDGELVADLQLYDRWKHLAGTGPQYYQWRSGVKHDCSKVMELRRCGPGSYVNGFQQEVGIERRFLFPMLKGSELTNGVVAKPTRWMLVTQSATGQDTARIESEAPRTWRYLCAHADWLNRRGSTIYQNRPRFSVFGVGAYAFQPWRVAIAGFYKKLNFQVVGSFEDKPIVLDDTCYFVPCGSQAEAVCVHGLLHSKPAQEFLNAFVFWDSEAACNGRATRPPGPASCRSRGRRGTRALRSATPPNWYGLDPNRFTLIVGPHRACRRPERPAVPTKPCNDG